jgi:hypothetical protein
LLKKAKIGILVVIVIVIIVAIGISSSGPKQSDAVFHVTLADPSLYQNGVYTNSFEISPGKYQFNFVPNGDSPEILTISMDGDVISWQEEFELEGTAVISGISEYYTWDYIGEKIVYVFEEQSVQITIDPHENFLGPVSVQLIKIE